MLKLAVKRVQIKQRINLEEGLDMNTLRLLNNRKWNPFHEVDALNNLIFGNRLPEGRQQESSSGDWVPLVDIVEGENEFLIKVELAEIGKKDISVKVEEGVLTISGVRKAEVVSDEKKFHRVERSYGKFIRTFRVPENTDSGKVAAEFKDGVLRVTLPKVEEAKPKAIEVAVA